MSVDSRLAGVATALIALLTLLLAAAMVACSGGSTTPIRAPGIPSRNGQGVNPVLNQSVTFSVIIPAVSSSPTIRRRRLDGTSPSPSPTALYISPHTGSVSITLAAVNGVSLAQPAPTVAPVSVPANCAPTGCTVTVANVPAATGVNSFAVETFVGPGGTGALISAGVVDVSAPSSGAQPIGTASSATLRVGGFVASVTVSVTPAIFRQGTPSTSSVVVVPEDATGAVLIGNIQFANPIQLSLSDATHFSFSGHASSMKLTSPPSSALSLNYDGGSSSTVNLTATTTDGGGNAVSASVALIVSLPTPPPSPSPSPSPSVRPSPSHGPRPSLYVLNAENNAVEEFPSPAPSATPRRSFGLTLSQLSCDPGAVPYSVAMVQGITIDASGNAYITNNPLCNTTTLLPFTTYQFSPSAVASTAPSASFAMPGAYAVGTFQSLGLDLSSQQILVPGADASSGTPAVLRASFSGGHGTLASVLGGGACIPLIGLTTCDGVDVYSGQNAYTVATDSLGYTYLGGTSDTSGNTVILVFAPGTTVPIVFSALDGPSGDTQLGIYPVSMAIDHGILYVLNVPSGPGLSNCGPIGSATINCADGNPHEYVTAYDTSKLTAGASVDLVPLFILGGDSVGRFGSGSAAGIAAGAGQRLAANAGVLYVANPTGPFCDTTCDGNASSGTAPPPGEVDVYNVAGLTGVHTDIAPAIVLQEPNLVPDGVAIGPRGTATGPPIPAPAGVRGRFYARMGHRLKRVH